MSISKSSVILFILFILSTTLTSTQARAADIVPREYDEENEVNDDDYSIMKKEVDRLREELKDVVILDDVENEGPIDQVAVDLNEEQDDATREEGDGNEGDEEGSDGDDDGKDENAGDEENKSLQTDDGDVDQGNPDKNGDDDVDQENPDKKGDGDDDGNKDDVVSEKDNRSWLEKVKDYFKSYRFYGGK